MHGPSVLLAPVASSDTVRFDAQLAMAVPIDTVGNRSGRSPQEA